MAIKTYPISGFLLVVSIFSTPTQSQNMTVQAPDSVEPYTNSSIIFYREGENGYYGNNVTLRTTYLPDSANKAWYDEEVILPNGRLRKFFLMAHNYSQLDDASTRIRLQIWRPVDLTNYTLKLVWQQVVQVPTSTKVAILYTYTINETVDLVYGDRIGWTFEGRVGPISFQYAESHRTRLQKVDPPPPFVPQIGQTVQFDSVYLPAIFSVAVSIDAILSPDSVVPYTNSSIIFYREGQNGYYGNNVTLRTTYLPDSANKAWYDEEVILPNGRLRKFFMMAPSYSQLDEASTRIRLQIWRPVDLVNYRLMLVWQQVVQLPASVQVAMLYTYAINETVDLMYGDRIGWTFEGTVGPISFQYVESHRTRLQKLNPPPSFLPQVGQTVEFEPVYLPSIFSVAVSVDSSFPGSSVSTGITTGALATKKTTTQPRNADTTGSLGSIGPTSAPNATGITETNSSIIFYREGQNGYYGNNVTLRTTYLPDSANKAWYDEEVILPNGRLRKFFIMAPSYSQLDDPSTRIRLQIWRPVDLTNYTLKLVWQQVVQLPASAQVAMLYTYTINETVDLLDGDRIGWTFEGKVGPISFQYVESHRTRLQKLNPPPSFLPQVGQTVEFDSVYLPGIFSVAVSVDTQLSTPSTGSNQTTEFFSSGELPRATLLLTVVGLSLLAAINI